MNKFPRIVNKFPLIDLTFSRKPKCLREGQIISALGTSTDLSENRPYGYVTDPDRTDTDGTDTVLSGISVAILK